LYQRMLKYAEIYVETFASLMYEHKNARLETGIEKCIIVK